MSQPSRGSSARVRSQSRASSFAAGGRTTIEQTISFACKYGFKPEGVRVVTQWYEQGLGALNLPSSYDYKLNYNTASHIFSFTAPDYAAEDILEVLVKVTERLVIDECGGGNYEEYEEYGRVLNPNSTKLWVLEESGGAEKATVPSDDERYPIEIRFYLAKREWNSKVANKQMAAVITKEVQERISESTGATLVEDLNQQKIFVAGNEEPQVSLAVKKLENVQRFWTEREREDYHVFYTETLTDFQVCFQMFPTIKKKLPETTLLDPGEFEDIWHEYSLLGRRVTVRCCCRQTRYGKSGGNVYTLKKGEKLRPVIHEDQKQNPSLKWVDFSYAKKGNWTDPKSFGATDGSILTENRGPLNMADISNWTQGLPNKTETIETEIYDLIHPRNPEDLSSHPLFTEHPKVAMASVTPNEENIRPGTHASSRHDPESLSTLTAQDGTPAFPFPASRNDDPFVSPRALPQIHSSFGTAMTLPVSTREVFPRLPPTVPQASHSKNQMASLKLAIAAIKGGLPEPSRTTSTNTQDTPHISTHSLGTSNVRPLAHTPAVGGASSHAESFVRNTITQPFTSGMSSTRNSHAKIQSGQPDPGSLIDLSDDGGMEDPANSDLTGSLGDLEGLQVPSMIELMPVEDLDMAFGDQPAPNAVQNGEDLIPGISENQSHAQDEPSTRIFHHTMRQKAPAISKANFFKGAPSTINPSHECLESVERRLGQILSQMRSYGGNLTLKAELGRFMILKNMDGHFIYNPENYNSVDIHQAEIALSAARTDFTKLVTMLPAEAQFVLEMKDDRGQRMWKDQPTVWPQLRYVFSCRDKTSNTWFTIEMDGESHSVEVKSESYTFGIVNVHGTLRNWDFRIIGQGSESSEHEDWVKEFVTSISIPENRQKLEMTFEMAEKIEILSLRVRRECEHTHMNGECTLHIDEVEDMYIRTLNTTGKPKTKYWIKAHDEETNPPKLLTRNWFEFSITCRCADEAFKENQNLDIGEEATWGIDDLNNRGLIWYLCHPMSQIVSKGDGLGFWNVESRPDPEPEDPTPDTPDAVASRPGTMSSSTRSSGRVLWKR